MTITATHSKTKEIHVSRQFGWREFEKPLFDETSFSSNSWRYLVHKNVACPYLADTVLSSSRTSDTDGENHEQVIRIQILYSRMVGVPETLHAFQMVEIC